MCGHLTNFFLYFQQPNFLRLNLLIIKLAVEECDQLLCIQTYTVYVKFMSVYTILYMLRREWCLDKTFSEQFQKK